MNAPTAPSLYIALIGEVDERVAQALDNFFPRSRPSILDGIVQTAALEHAPAIQAAGRSCREWLSVRPEQLSAAFAAQFRQLRTQSDGRPAESPAGELRLMDDDQIACQMAEAKASAFLLDALRAEMHPLFGRLAALGSQNPVPLEPSALYGPQAMMQCLSAALGALVFDDAAKALMLRHVAPALQDTLRQTYVALDQYLAAQGIEPRGALQPAPPRPRTDDRPSVGESLLARIRAGSASRAVSEFPSGAVRPNFADALKHRQTVDDTTGGLDSSGLPPLQTLARNAGADAFELAMLNAIASLFEFILTDTDLSNGYKSGITRLQIPTLRVALDSPAFFSDDAHPARRLLDLLGRIAHRFPGSHPRYDAVLNEAEAACTHVAEAREDPTAAFADAGDRLALWLADEGARADAGLTPDIENLERIERRELGTLLALENLRDLTARYPAPHSVLRQMEAAWVPHMSDLYLAEAGEGPRWRAACTTLRQLFHSLQPPGDETAREMCLQSLPHINAELRAGLLAQGAGPSQLKEFFEAITATQECWVRPTLGHREDTTCRFVPEHASPPGETPFIRKPADEPMTDSAERQVSLLQEGDWVDFDPPCRNLATARIAWVGVRGYLLFCDSEGETRFSLESRQLADEIRAGHANIPEQSLTRKAMLRLHSDLQHDVI